MFPERIVCLAAEIPNLLFQLGALDRVVGISAYTQFPEEALHIPKVSGFKMGSIQRIQSVKPDLAILTSNVQKELAMGLADAGIPVLHLQPHRLDDVFHNITLIGNIVGMPKKAEELNQKLRHDVEEIRRMAEKLSRRPRVYFEEWMDPIICGTGWVSDLIEIAGGQDVFRHLSVNGRKAQDRIVQPDEVIKAEPELILASWCGKPFEKSSLIARERFEEIPAVRHQQVFEVNSLILQCGPSLIQSARELHERIKAYVEERNEDGDNSERFRSK